MLTRRKLALLATAALITGLIAGPTIAFGGGSSDPTKTEPEPAADVAKTDADVAEPNSDADVDEPGAEHPDSGSDVHEICTGDGIGVFDGGHEGFHDFGPRSRARSSRLKIVRSSSSSRMSSAASSTSSGSTDSGWTGSAQRRSSSASAPASSCKAWSRTLTRLPRSSPTSV